MKGYLLDTNICVFALRGDSSIAEKFKTTSERKYYVSDVTVMELRYGAYRSAKAAENLALINVFLKKIRVIPFAIAIDTFCQEKVRLQRAGLPLEDYDLLIGSTAKTTGLTLVTHNVKHFERIEGLVIEDWMQ